MEQLCSFRTKNSYLLRLFNYFINQRTRKVKDLINFDGKNFHFIKNNKYYEWIWEYYLD